MAKIVECTIGPYPKGFGDPMPVVHVRLDDNTEVDLFDFYPDELSFCETEFLGLTVEEGRHLKFLKDKAFLQS